jgi:hypothetical protein
LSDRFFGKPGSSLPSPVTISGLPGFPRFNPALLFVQSSSQVKLGLWRGLLMTREPDSPASRGSSNPEEPTQAARIQALLDHILEDGTYHVSAAEIARKILDNMQEPWTVSLMIHFLLI